MYDHEPTLRARYVGHELLRAAQRKGFNASDMADMLGWSPSKVSRLLSGKRVTSTEDVAAFLALSGVTGPARSELLMLAAQGRETTWWQDHGTRPPICRTALVHNEAAAKRITFYGDAVVPDLLQVPEYTRALLAAQLNIPDDEIEARAAETARRQRILDREFNPPQLHVILAEYALTRTGAGRAAMCEQAHHLLRLAVRPHITIRIVPDEVEVGAIKPFMLLEFTEYQPAVCLEHDTCTTFLERPDTVNTYRTTIAALDQRALGEADSRDHIADIARRLARQHSDATAYTRTSSTDCAVSAELTGIWANG